MTAEEIFAMCIASLEHAKQRGEPPSAAAIIIGAPKGWQSPADMPSPDGMIRMDDGSRDLLFPTLPILDWLASRGYIERITVAP